MGTQSQGRAEGGPQSQVGAEGGDPVTGRG